MPAAKAEPCRQNFERTGAARNHFAAATRALCEMIEARDPAIAYLERKRLVPAAGAAGEGERGRGKGHEWFSRLAVSARRGICIDLQQAAMDRMDGLIDRIQAIAELLVGLDGVLGPIGIAM